MNDSEHLYMQGLEAYQRGDFDRAATCFGTAFTRDPGFVPAHNGLGLVLLSLGAYPEALDRLDTAIRINPNFAPPFVNRGLALRALNRIPEALASFDHAIKLQPENFNAHSNRGGILGELGHRLAAVAAFDRALAIKPDCRHAAGLRLMNKVLICDWTNLNAELNDLAARLERGENASPPGPLLALLDRPDLSRKAAETWIASDRRENPALGPIPKRPHPARIKLGYYSWDYHRHATAHLVAELFERHDRTKFEVIAFSWGPPTGDDMEARLKAGFDRFIDVSQMNDYQVAHLSREIGIDIAIDLKGITTSDRLGIFAFRAAPIQVHYLAYPGTIGAPYIDYLIADDTLIPDTHRRFYRETVVNLPGSYQVNDGKRKVSEQVFTRADVGLPAEGFVFCSFNNSYKIMPKVYDIWMRILKAVPGSVLWLIDDNAEANANLRKEAEARGVDPARLIFAPRIVVEDHMARQKLADLFLDTWPYTAHTSASDALWVGVPVLTFPGEAFPTRVAASLLKAVGMPELIAATAAEYETLAIALATDPPRLQALKDRLLASRSTASLFDCTLFARNLEAAFQQMVDTHYGPA